MPFYRFKEVFDRTLESGDLGAELLPGDRAAVVAALVEPDRRTLAVDPFARDGADWTDTSMMAVVRYVPPGNLLAHARAFNRNPMEVERKVIRSQLSPCLEMIPYKTSLPSDSFSLAFVAARRIHRHRTARIPRLP